MQQTIKSEQGSFLLELAITILILGLIGAGVAQYAGHVTKAGDAVQTKKRMDVVSKALSTYVQTNFRLPCPAPPVGAGSNGDFGSERASCNGANAHGIIPYRTLGIPEFYANDGYGNYFTYVVSPGFTGNNQVPALGVPVNIHPRLTARIAANNVSLIPMAQFCAGADLDGFGGLDIAGDLDVDQGGEDIIGQARSTQTQVTDGTTGLPRNADTNYFRDPSQVTNFVTAPAAAIVSHGENGWGAYTKNGGQFLTGNGGTTEQSTATQNNNIDLERNVSDILTGGANDRFDDVVLFFTQEQILALGGGGSCEEL